jgi:CRISPR/Cas system-associated exonuclease Cas4 (RecB family)
MADYQIETHISDVGSYLRCRRQWWWGSHLGCNLEAKVPRSYFTYGRVVHYGLDQMYQHDQDPVEAMYKWAEQEVKALATRLGILPEQLADEYVDLFAKIAKVLRHYQLWIDYSQVDEEISSWLAHEQEFVIPLYRSPGVRASGVLKYAGRMDGVVTLRGYGDIPWVHEVKTARSIKPGSLEYLTHDLQASMYIRACQQLYGSCGGVYYTFIRKKPPADPRVLKSGGLSSAKNQDTTPYWWLHKAQELTGDPRELLTAVWQDFLVNLEQQHTPFFRRIKITRPQRQIQAAVNTVYSASLEMRRLARTVPNPRGYEVLRAEPSWLDCRQNGCQFYLPCLIELQGGDWRQYLRANYAQRRGWDPDFSREEDA